jgi:hypothetical protein
MLDEILREAAERSRPVTYPSAYYSPDGDCVFFYNEGGEYIRHRASRLLTLFRDPDDQRILGLQIKGVKRLPPHDGIGVEVGSGEFAGGRLDVVRVLLLSFREDTEDEDAGVDDARTTAYAEAFSALGCRPLEVELA